MKRSPQEPGSGNNICISSLVTARPRLRVEIRESEFNTLVSVFKIHTKSHHWTHVLRRGTAHHQWRAELLSVGKAWARITAGELIPPCSQLVNNAAKQK